MSTLAKGFGRAVRQSREARGWSQEELAAQADLHRTYVGEIERGCVAASLATVEKLAAALSLAPATLIAQGQPAPAPPPAVMAIAC